MRLDLGFLVSGLGLFRFFLDKTTGRDKKDESEDQSANNVILNRSAPIGPNEYVSGYLARA